MTNNDGMWSSDLTAPYLEDIRRICMAYRYEICGYATSSTAAAAYFLTAAVDDVEWGLTQGRSLQGTPNLDRVQVRVIAANGEQASFPAKYQWVKGVLTRSDRLAFHVALTQRLGDLMLQVPPRGEVERINKASDLVAAELRRQIERYEAALKEAGLLP